MENKYFQRLGAVSGLMAEKGWDALILSGADPHGSEEVADRWKAVEWLSGFTGEGEIAVTSSHAGLWTDSRYFIQAAEELRDTGFLLHKTGEALPEWLARHFSDENRRVTVVVDGLTRTAASVAALREAFVRQGREAENLRIVNVPDVLDPLWEDRSPVPVTPILTLGDALTGESRRSKLAWLREFLLARRYGAILLSALDEIAWLLNVRGQDLPYSPVVISYLLVTMDEVRWYVRKNRLDRPDEETLASFAELREDGVEICPYDDVGIGIANLPEEAEPPLFAASETLDYSLYDFLVKARGDKVVFGPSPVAVRKAVKNEVEIEGLREVHVEDGAVMERFLYWLENRVDYSDGLDEREAADRLDALRARVQGFKGLSFKTISAFGSHAALPHYSTPAGSSALIDGGGLYLCDSGGQYLYGTTDITRTVPFGPCSRTEKLDYTIALKGHIGLAKAVFPKGTAGCQLDALARGPMWQYRRNYGHGTGHGVGAFLHVHEGPQSIRQDFNPQPLLPGMVVSDEPGIYREGSHGVRHENLLLCREAGAGDFGEWLGFEVLTLCHIDTSILELSLMAPEETAWLNAYHRRVYETLSPRLPKEIASWLRAKTRPI